MLNKEDRLSLLHRVASLYYLDGKKKFEISSLINQSPTQVGLLLKEAIDEEIVTIKVNFPRFSVLRKSLIEKFDLIDVVIVPSSEDLNILFRNLSNAAAQYFEENISDGKKIAIGGGYLMYRMIENLDDKTRDIDIYPTAVMGRGPSINHIDPIALVTVLWAKSGLKRGRAHYVTLTPTEEKTSVEKIKKHYDLLKRNIKLKQLVNEIRSVDYVFTSIGDLNSDQEYIEITNRNSKNLLDELGIAKEYLRKSNAIGDVAYSFFDNAGRTKPEWELFPNIGLMRLREMAKSEDKKVVVTVGKYKINSLKAILISEEKLCNVLITDSDAAEILLNQ